MPHRAAAPPHTEPADLRAGQRPAVPRQRQVRPRLLGLARSTRASTSRSPWARSVAPRATSGAGCWPSIPIACAATPSGTCDPTVRMAASGRSRRPRPSSSWTSIPPSRSASPPAPRRHGRVGSRGAAEAGRRDPRSRGRRIAGPGRHGALQRRADGQGQDRDELRPPGADAQPASLLARLAALPPGLFRPRWAGYATAKLEYTRAIARPGRSTGTSSGRGSGRRSTAPTPSWRPATATRSRSWPAISPNDGMWRSSSTPTRPWAGMRGDVQPQHPLRPDDMALIAQAAIAQIRSGWRRRRRTGTPGTWPRPTSRAGGDVRVNGDTSS